MKMQSTNGGWIIIDKGVAKFFEEAHDAWQYILLMKEIRPSRTYLPKTLYPVRSLTPFAQVKGVKKYVRQN